MEALERSHFRTGSPLVVRDGLKSQSKCTEGKTLTNGDRTWERDYVNLITARVGDASQPAMTHTSVDQRVHNHFAQESFAALGEMDNSINS